MLIRRFRTTTLFVAAFALAGCAAEVADDGIATAEEGDSPAVAWSTSALSIPQCVSPPSANVTKTLDLSGDVSSSTTAQSPDTSYFDSASHSWVVQLNGIASQDILPTAGWGAGEPVPTSQSACSKAHIDIGVYGFDPNANCWLKIAARAKTGVWQQVWFFGQPSFVCTIGAGGDVTVNTQRYTSLRIAARAYRTVPLGNASLTFRLRAVAGAINFF